MRQRPSAVANHATAIAADVAGVAQADALDAPSLSISGAEGTVQRRKPARVFRPKPREVEALDRLGGGKVAGPGGGIVPAKGMNSMTEVTGRDGYILHRAVSEARRHEDAQGFPPDVNVVRVLQGQSFPHLRPTLARALYFAIKYQESLPDDEREWSNMQDMIALLLALFPREAKRLVKADKAAGREPAVLIDEKAPR